MPRRDHLVTTSHGRESVHQVSHSAAKRQPSHGLTSDSRRPRRLPRHPDEPHGVLTARTDRPLRPWRGAGNLTELAGTLVTQAALCLTWLAPVIERRRLESPRTKLRPNACFRASGRTSKVAVEPAAPIAVPPARARCPSALSAEHSPRRRNRSNRTARRTALAAHPPPRPHLSTRSYRGHPRAECEDDSTHPPPIGALRHSKLLGHYVQAMDWQTVLVSAAISTIVSAVVALLLAGRVAVRQRRACQRPVRGPRWWPTESPHSSWLISWS